MTDSVTRPGSPVSRRAARAALILAFTAAALFLQTACEADRRSQASNQPGPLPTATPSPSLAVGGTPGVTSTPSSAEQSCAYGPAQRLSVVQDRAVKEASALAASSRWPGAYWTLNDSGNNAMLYAIDTSGRKLAAVLLDRTENTDWEALQFGPGGNGEQALYIGDVGDNDRERRDAVIYRLAEPDLSGGADRPATGRTAPAEAFRFEYPNGPRNVEALLVHPTSGEIVLVSKEPSGRARVFRYPGPLNATQRVTLEQIGELDLTALGPVAGLVTDGAVSPEGRRLVLRTYGFALEYDLPTDGSLAAILQRKPRIAALNDGPQGEGITYRIDGRALLTIGEGVPAILHQLEWRCQ